MKKRVECIVFGRVQMVMYRDFAVRNARKNGLVGQVCNKPDGTVFLVAEGEEELLQNYILLLQKGSLLSRVAEVRVEWVQPTGEFSRFDIRY